MTIIRGKILLKEPFFGSLLIRLNSVKTEAVGTAGVDGKNLFYSEKFFNSINDDNAEAVLLHEIFHVALQHLDRGKNRLINKFRIAADLATNSLLEKYNYKLPKGCLLPKQFKLDDCLSVEEYYEKLNLPFPPSMCCPPCGSSNIRIKKIVYGDNAEAEVTYECKDCKATWKHKVAVGDGGCGYNVGDLIDDKTEIVGKRPFEDYHGKMSEKEKSDWKIWVAEAAHIARQRGRLPGEFEELISEFLNPKLNWREILRRFVTESLKNEYSWFPPNRRYIHSGLIMPSLNSQDKLGVIVLTFDTSGSVSTEEIKQYLGEAQEILNAYDVEMHIIQHDVKVTSHEIYNFGDYIGDEFKIKGRGGTSHIPVFEYIEKNIKNPSCVVSMTDGYTDVPKSVSFKLLWVLSKNYEDTIKQLDGEITKLDKVEG